VHCGNEGWPGCLAEYAEASFGLQECMSSVAGTVVES